MSNPSYPATIALLVLLLILSACSDPTPTLDTDNTPVPTTIAPTSVPTATPPVPTHEPAPTATTRPTAAPPTTPMTPPTQPAQGTLAPLDIKDPQAMADELSDAELSCLDGDSRSLERAFAGLSRTSPDEAADVLNCLNDETIARLFLAGFIPGPEPLSEKSSECVRAAFQTIDPRSAMTAGLEGNPGLAMAKSTTGLLVTMACLTDEEWEKAGPQTGISSDERAGMKCLVETLGGPGQLATAMTLAQEGDSTELAAAGAECGLDTGPIPVQPTVAAPPTPTPTPRPEPTATPTTTPTQMPTPTPTALPPTTEAPTPAPTQRTSQSAPTWRGLTVAPEDRCSDYDADDYHYSPSVEPKIVDAQGGIYGPYTGTWFETIKDTDIEHIVARSEAHDSGLCAADPDTWDRFASDLINLTLASPSVNRHQKSDNDAAEWLPELNQCWYVDRVVQVRQEYGLTIDRTEADAIDRVLSGCESTEMVVLAPEAPATATPTPTPAPEADALTLYDDNGNGRITCAEARAHGIAPVRRGHPAYEFMRDADGDGVVCE